MPIRTLAAQPFKGDAPTAFQIFAAGANDTEKGVIIFDAAAAASVLDNYAARGVDFMIDLNHDSIDDPSGRPDSADARGWFQIELRPDGSLWAVNVRWTPDGARRLAEKTQRYISPAFYADASGRVEELVNVAICAMPATHDAPALVAASRFGAKGSKVVTCRLTKEQARRVKILTTGTGITVSHILRFALSGILKFNAGAPDGATILTNLIEMFGMPPASSPIDVLKVVTALFESLIQGGSSGAAPAVDTSPPRLYRFAATPSVNTPTDAAKLLKAVAAALGMPEESTVAEVSDAFQEVIAAISGASDNGPPLDPTADGADGAPPQALTVQRELERGLREIKTAREETFRLAGLPELPSARPVTTGKVNAVDPHLLKQRFDKDRRLRQHGMTREEFEVRKAVAVRRATDDPEETAQLRELSRRLELARRHGMTLEELEARRATAVRRMPR